MTANSNDKSESNQSAQPTFEEDVMEARVSGITP
jgi:hypothetical protein